MNASGVVTLLTDFGVQDPFVGVMKGVILGRNPAARLVDLTHHIEPQCVAAGAFWLGETFRYFPAGSVHLAVVDPGVGSERAGIILEASGHFFVGPDNGLFERVVARSEGVRAFRIDGARAGLAEVSRTFHGRDVFAPVAAELSRGVQPEALGAAGELTPTALLAEPRWQGAELLGEIVTSDHFGNLVTNIQVSDLRKKRIIFVECRGVRLALGGTFAELSAEVPGVLLGSFGYLEICLRNGSAKRQLGAQRGTPLRVSFERERA
jgi:S-adenosylmethionine hydrolase